jgi:hypothetical protein
MQQSQIHPSISVQLVTSDICNIRTRLEPAGVTPPKHMEAQHFVAKIERVEKVD